MSPLLDDTVLSCIGNSAEPQTELVTRRDIRKYSVATGQRLRKYLDGEEAPPLFHIPLFWDVVELDQLLPDGLSVDPLLPDFPLKRAMAGGWNIRYHRPIVPGDELVMTRTISNIYEIAIQAVKPDQTSSYPQARADFLRVLKRTGRDPIDRSRPWSSPPAVAVTERSYTDQDTSRY